LPAILAHELPGRLRFSLPGLRGDAERAAALRDALAGLAGVQAVNANALTGSVLVRHDGDAATRDRIVGAIRLAGYRLMSDSAARGTTVRAGTRPAAAFAEPLIQAAVEKLLERMLLSALTAII
jgi:copper chaperone CopZ